MTSITKTNNLTSSNSVSSPKAAPGTESSKVSAIASQLYRGPGSTTLPGMTNIYYSPMNLYEGLKALFTAYSIGDNQGVVENGIRVLQAPSGFTNAAISSAFNIANAGVYLKLFDHPSVPILLTATSPLAKAATIIGFFICFFELILEAYGLIRVKNFLERNYPFELDGLKEAVANEDPKLRQMKFFRSLDKNFKDSIPDEIIDKLSKKIKSIERKGYVNDEKFLKSLNEVAETIQINVYQSRLTKLQNRYFQISPEKMKEINEYVKNKLSHLTKKEQNERIDKIIETRLERKVSKLTRQIHPWLVTRIEQSIPTLLEDLENDNPITRRDACKKAEELFTNIKIQSQKKELLHGIGLTAVALTFAGLIATCILCPVLVSIVLLLVGGGVAVVRGLVYEGAMDSEGWNFSVKACFPEAIRGILFGDTADTLVNP